jgi:Zn-finger nucleic acid-binding protein
MKCPVCDVPLSISSREGVEIDFCPQCRGVWLDRGELDKVIDRAAAAMAPASPAGGRGREYEDRRRYDDDDDRQPEKKRKKRSFLQDLFEFE